MSIAGRLKERAEDVALTFLLFHPVASLVIIIGLVVLALWLIAKLIPYLFMAAALVVVGLALWYIVSSGLLFAVLRELREHRERYIPLAALLFVGGLAIPYVMQPVVYADFRINFSYNLTSSEGLFGFVVTVIDLNSIDYSILSTGASSGVPVFHVVKASPDYRTEAGDKGYWLCFRSDDETAPTVCWPVRGTDVLSALVGGTHREESFIVYGYPVRTEGYLFLELYRDGQLVWRGYERYVVSVPGVELNVTAR